MLYIKKINKEDIEEEYNFLINTPLTESGFNNPFCNIKKENFEHICIDFLLNLANLSAPNDFFRPTTTYFLWLDSKIIGVYQVIHELDEKLKNSHGHISYSILKDYRNKGYGSKGLELVLEKAKKLIKEDEIYMHTSKDNQASLKVMINNGAYIAKETENDYYTRIKK